MIEKAHMNALRVFRKMTDRAIEEGRLADAKESAGQTAATLALEEARREIFARHGVGDISLEEYELWREDVISIQELFDRGELSARAYHGLTRNGITNVAQLATVSNSELSRIRNLGRRSVASIIEVKGKYLGMNAGPSNTDQS